MTDDAGQVCFIDTETTGLDTEVHEVWEVGLIVREAPFVGEGSGAAASRGTRWCDTEYRWLLPVDLGRADPVALRIGGFHHRHPQGHRFNPNTTEDQTAAAVVVTADRVEQFARALARLTAGRHLVGAVVSFDEERLRKLLKANGACPEWHYHLVDSEALAAGWLARRSKTPLPGYEEGSPAARLTAGHILAMATPPWDSNELSMAVGVDPEDYDRHTALGDARWARDLYDAVMGP